MDNMKNTAPEAYDEAVNEQDEPMTSEEILMNERDILSGLLEADKERDNAQTYRKVQIKRKGKVYFEFRIRPITEDESQKCWRNATKYAPLKPGQPKKAIETNSALYRSFIVYTATVDEDRAKVWDNRVALEKMGLLRGVEMVDKVLLAGEKSRILDLVDEISGFDDGLEEAAQD